MADKSIGINEVAELLKNEIRDIASDGAKAGSDFTEEFMDSAIKGIKKRSKEFKSELTTLFEDFNRMTTNFKSRKSVTNAEWQNVLRMSNELLKSDRYADAVREKLNDIAVTFNNIGKVSGIDNIVRELAKAEHALESVQWSETGKNYKKKSTINKTRAKKTPVATDPKPAIDAEKTKQKEVVKTTEAIKEETEAQQKLNAVQKEADNLAKKKSNQKKNVEQQTDALHNQKKASEAAAEAASKQNKVLISSYQDLYDALKKVVELSKQLKPEYTAEFEGMQTVMDKASHPDDKKSLVASIKAQYENVQRIKSSIKNGLSVYKDIDGSGHEATYSIEGDTLKNAEDMLRAYIYQAVEYFGYTITDVMNDFSQKRVRTFIEKTINQYLTASSKNDEFSADANVFNAPIKEVIDSITSTIYGMVTDVKNLNSVSDDLSELKYRAENVNRYTLSSQANYIGSKIGINTPYDEIQLNAKKIESYEELCDVVARYNTLQEKAVIFGGNDYPGLNEEEEIKRQQLKARLEATGGKDIYKLSGFHGFENVEKLASALGIEIPKAIEKSEVAQAEFTEETKNTVGVQNKLKESVKDTSDVLYHAGDLSNLSNTLKSFPLGNVPPTRSNGIGGLTGLYTTDELDGFIGNEWQGAPISTIDPSGYNLLRTRTNDIAEKVGSFLNDVNATIYGYYNAIDEQDWEMKRYTDVKSVEDLYEAHRELFKESSLTFEQFTTFINNSKEKIAGKNFADIELPAIDEGIAKSGISSAMQDATEELFNSDSFQTQFLKMLGYEGVDLRGTKYNGTYTGGTVIFDVKPESIKETNAKWSDVMARNGYEVTEDDIKFEEKRRQLAFETAEAYSKQASATKEVVNNAGNMPDNTVGDWASEVQKLEDYVNSLGEEFKNSEHYRDNFNILVDGIKSGSMTAEQAIKEINAAFKDFNIDGMGALNQSFEDTLANLPKLTSNEISNIFNNVDLSGFLTSLNVDESNFSAFRVLFEDLMRITKAMGEGADVSAAFDTQIDKIIESIMRLGGYMDDFSDFGMKSEMQEFQKYMNNKMIRYNDTIKSDYTKDDWKGLFGAKGRFKNRVTKDATKGMSADELWDEIKTLFPGLFPQNEDRPQEQFKLIFSKLAEAIDLSKSGWKVERGFADSDRGSIISSVAQVYNEMGSKLFTAESSSGMMDEADAAKQVEQSMVGAATAKGKFANANKQVGSSADASADQLDNEAESMDALTASAEKLPDGDIVTKLFLGENEDPSAAIVKQMRIIGNQMQTEAKKLTANEDGEWDVSSSTITEQKLRGMKDYIKEYSQEAKKLNGIEANIRTLGDGGMSSGLADKVKTYTASLEDMSRAMQELQNNPNDPAASMKFDDAILKAKNARTEIEGIFKESKKLKSIGELKAVGDEDVSKIKNLKGAMVEFVNSAFDGEVTITGFNKEGTEMYATLSKGADAVENITVALDKASGQLNAFSTGTKKATNEWNLLKQQAADGVKRFAAMYLGFNDIIRYGRQGLDYVKEIDLAMTELKKVTDETDEAYKQFLSDAGKTSAIIGSTISDFTEASATFARLGYSLEESSRMAETAIIYKNVADGLDSVEESSQSIISTMMAFGIAANDTMSIIDRFNAVGKYIAQAI